MHERQLIAYNISVERLKQIEKELNTDTKKYLQNCRNNYAEYMMAAQHLFSETYKKMQKIDERGDPWTKYNLIATQLKKEGNTEQEIEILKKAVSENIYTPGTYRRLAILHEKNKDFKSAYNVCKKWFDSDYWKIPNMAVGSIWLLKKLEKLKEKLNNSS